MVFAFPHLRCGADSERSEDDVDDALRRQHIAADDGGVVRRIEQTAGRDAHLDRDETALKTKKEKKVHLFGETEKTYLNMEKTH